MTFLGIAHRRILRSSFNHRLFGITLLALISIASDNSLTAQSTNIAIGATVKQPSVKRLGVNLGGQDFYDSGQMLRNLTFRNPGFEGETWQSVIKCAAVTTTSCTDADPWNIWPANFLQGATYEVINGAALGETGTITGNTISAYEAGNTTNPSYGITFSFTAPKTLFEVGDYVIVRSVMPGNAQAGWWTSASGGASLSTDFSDIAPNSPGKQALKVEAAASGQSASVTSYFDSYGTRSFVQLNGIYTVAFKAKGLGGNNQLNISVSRVGKAGNYFSQTVSLTGEWQDYTYSFHAAENGSALGTVQLSFSVAGASLYLDDATLTAPAAANNPTAYRNEVVDALQSLKPGVIRYMAGTDFGTSIANAIAVPFARQRAGISSTDVEDVPAGLEEFLVLCQTVGAEPWYTMAGEASPTDMQNLIEFLGGDATTPYGAKRAALGQSAPWTTVFPVIHLELGNEMWNSSMTYEAIPDPVVYGQRAAAVFAAAHSSSSYDASKFDLIMGSWAVNSWWTQQEMANSSGYDSVDSAPYLFYTLSDYSSNESIFGPMFAQPEQLDSRSTGYMAQQAAAAGASNPAKLAVYEVNLSTVSGTAPQNVVNQVVGGVGAGITVADHMLLMMRDLGITTQCMFALSEYANGFSNPNAGGETTPLWGAVIDMGGETNVQRPQFLAEQLANGAIYPTMLATTITGANPTWNQPLSANDTTTPIQLADAHYLQSFAFADGARKSVIVFNLSRAGSLPVTFSGVNAPTGNVLISQLTSKNPTDNNEGLTTDNPVVASTHASVNNFNPAASYSLPPYSMTVFAWPATTLPPSTTVLTAAPPSATLGQTVALTAQVTSNGNANTPTGIVTFLDGSTTLGTATLNSSGAAAFSTTSLPAGSNVITASYSGNSSDSGSVSTAVSVSVANAAINFSQGFTQGQMQLNGSSALSGTSLRLTDGGLFEAASAFYPIPVNVQSFTTNFTFQLSDPIADGITFTIQDSDVGALGGFGESLGFAGIAKSVAIKFDLHNNAGEGPDSTGVYTNGALPTVPAINLTDTGINLHSGDPMTAHITYNGASLDLTLTDTVTLATWSYAFEVDIPAIVGGITAYVGFTGGTGDRSSTQIITSWTY